MAENIEFIAAKDIPTTEAEEVNVLVVDPATGELAQKPGANLGGGSSGGEAPDMVITVNASHSATQIVNGNYTITEGSADAVFAAFHAGRYPIIKVRFYNGADTDYTAIREEYDAYVCTYGEQLWISFIVLNPYHATSLYVHKVYMNGDGTVHHSDVMRATLATA